MKKHNIIYRYIYLPFVVMVSGLYVTSCTENIDMSNRYTFTEYTIASYLDEHDSTYSEYIQLLKDVQISMRSHSTVYQLLAARGKYTVFAPTNQAIHNYLDTLYAQGVITEPSWKGFKNQVALDSIKQVIIYNSILDGTKDDLEPIQSSGFPEDTKEFPIANMNERKLTLYYGTNPDSMYINGTRDDAGNITKGCLIDLKNRDIFTINGYIHQVHTVIAPSNETLGDLMKSYIDTNTGDYIVTAKLIIATGMADTLSKVKDEVYEALKQAEDGRVADLPPLGSEATGIVSGYLPEHRYYGFTIFAETDDFWRAELGKEPIDISPADVQEWVVSKGFYPNALNNKDYSNENNALNQFLTYHILPMRIPVDKLVIHYNERKYNYRTSTQFTVPTYELYTTMGKRRLLKIYQCGPSYSLDGGDKIYLNRFPVLANGRHDDYKEVSITPETQGIVVNTSNPTDLINAYIYPIDEPLVYDETTRTNFQKQRLRFDVASMLPELMNNGYRANRSKEEKPGFPIDANYKYLEDVDIEDGTRFYYLSGLGRNWNNWQGDEMNISGRYEFTFRLPPVPKAGTYELRYAVQSNSSVRSMCQVYFGTDKHNLPAMGIPLDIRMGGQWRRTSAGDFPSIVGWVQDDPKDDDYNAEVDKKMRNNGFMKGPIIYAFSPGGSNYARNDETTTRRIIVREYLYPDKVYYIKFKNVLDDDGKQHYMDYLEWCAKEVYDNPMTPEDIW